MKNIIEKCRTTRILGLIGIVGLILGIIMPYVTFNVFGYKYSLSLWGYWEGKIMMTLTVANLLFIFKDLVEKYVPSLFNSTIGQKIRDCKNPKFSLIPTVLCAILAIYLTSIVEVDNVSSFGLGFYVMWIGTLSLIAYAFLHKQDSNEYQMKM